jgi:hypothetical protein
MMFAPLGTVRVAARTRVPATAKAFGNKDG